MAVHAVVDRMDREIGGVLDQLRAMKALDDTLTFFLSDRADRIGSPAAAGRGRGNGCSTDKVRYLSHICFCGPRLDSGFGDDRPTSKPEDRYEQYTRTGR